MKTRILIIIGMIVILVGSLGILAISQQTEIECLRLYKEIRELSRTPEMSLAERETIDLHKRSVFEYVEKSCPDFPDLEFIYDNYLQIGLQSPTSSYMDKIVPTIDDFRKFASDSPDIDNIFYRFGEPADDIGSGIHIYVYELNDNTQVWIGYSNEILYVRNVNAYGNVLESLFEVENED
ncbi:MAG: hypothetical protein ACW9W4_07915 [Candidatus Nitrosopumilus sp. bin_7KS]